MNRVCENASHITSMPCVTEIVAGRSTAACNEPIECALLRFHSRWIIRGYLLLQCQVTLKLNYRYIIVHLLYADKLHLVADFTVVSNVMKFYPNLPSAKYADVMH